MTYSVEKIEDIQDFKRLKDAWNEVIKNRPSYRPFLEHEWFELWLNHFQDKRNLLILLVKDDSNVKAIFPMMVKTEKDKADRQKLVKKWTATIRNRFPDCVVLSEHGSK